MDQIVFKKKYLFYPNVIQENLVIDKKKKIKFTVNEKCDCQKDYYSYECENCKAGIKYRDISISNEFFKIVPEIERKIKELINVLPQKKIDISKININLERKDLINKLTLKEEIKSEEVLFKIFELNSNITNLELLYYSSKILDLIDHKIIFLQKFYQYLYSVYTNHYYGVYNFFYYKEYTKYEGFFDSFKLNLPINYDEFIELYQNTDDTHFSFVDVYPLDKHYKSEILDNRNVIYDLNFSTAAECRVKDNQIKFKNPSETLTFIKQIRDEIREEFGIKTKNKNLINENLLYINLKKIFKKSKILRNFRPNYLKGLELDFYLELGEKKIGIEYQGVQHYKPVKYFGGKKSFKNQKIKDKKKLKLCNQNKIILIEFPYTLDNTANNLLKLLGSKGVQI